MSEHAGRGADAFHQRQHCLVVVVETPRHRGDQRFNILGFRFGDVDDVYRGGEQSNRDRGCVGRSSKEHDDVSLIGFDDEAQRHDAVRQLKAI